MGGNENGLRKTISHEEYIRLRELRTCNNFLEELQKTVWRDAAEILKTGDTSLDDSMDQALQMCESEPDIDSFLETKEIEIEPIQF